MKKLSLSEMIDFLAMQGGEVMALQFSHPVGGGEGDGAVRTDLASVFVVLGAENVSRFNQLAGEVSSGAPSAVDRVTTEMHRAAGRVAAENVDNESGSYAAGFAAGLARALELL